MFERFTERARGTLAEARQLAKELKSPAIRRHHLLVALLNATNEGSGSVAAVLDDAGVDPGELRGVLLESLKGSETPLEEAASPAPFTAAAKKALELSLREALSLGHNYIGREHLLLGVLRSMDGPLAAAVGTTRLTHDRAREVVAEQSPPSRVAARRRMRGRDLRAFARRGLANNATPGLFDVLRRVQERAPDRDVTTGDFLVALLDTPGTHFEAALAGVTLDAAAIKTAVDRLQETGVPDGAEGGVHVDARGTVTFSDPRVAEEVKRLASEGKLTNEQLIDILRRLQG